MVPMDETDREILAILQENARTPLDQLAYRSDLSIATVQRRRKRLREAGVIKKEVALLDPTTMGYEMTFIVAVEMERESAVALETFKQRMIEDPNVQQCYYVTGDMDFILICYARNMKDYEEFTKRSFFEDANIRRFRTNVVMGRTKTGSRINTTAERSV